jgi:hypothetical protein
MHQCFGASIVWTLFGVTTANEYFRELSLLAQSEYQIKTGLCFPRFSASYVYRPNGFRQQFVKHSAAAYRRYLPRWFYFLAQLTRTQNRVPIEPEYRAIWTNEPDAKCGWSFNSNFVVPTRREIELAS